MAVFRGAILLFIKQNWNLNKCQLGQLTNKSPVYTAQTNPGRTRVRPGLKLTQVLFTRHFSKLTRVEPGLVVFTRQTNPGRTRVSRVYTTETNSG